MTPIHEMKTRKATWSEYAGEAASIDTQCSGVFFEVGGREVGVVIRDQPEDVAKPLIDAIAALPALIEAGFALLGRCANTGSRTRGCVEEGVGPCSSCDMKSALKAAGALP